MASFTNIKYNDIVIDSILLAVFGGQMDLVQMPFTLTCTKCMVTVFYKTAIHAWFKKFAHD